MKKKRSILLAAILVVVLAIVLSASFYHRRPIYVVGNPSAADVAAIKAVVSRDVRRRVFPDYSWSSFRNLGPNLDAYMKYDISEIIVPNSRWAVVNLEKAAKGSRPTCEYDLLKGPNGWKIAAIIPCHDNVLPSPESLGNFSSSSVIPDKSFSDMRLGPPPIRPMPMEWFPTNMAASTMQPPTSKARLADLMP